MDYELNIAEKKTIDETNHNTDVSICDKCKWRDTRFNLRFCDFPLMGAIEGEDIYNLKRSECKFYQSNEDTNDNKVSKKMLIDIFSTELKKFDN